MTLRPAIVLAAAIALAACDKKGAATSDTGAAAATSSAAAPRSSGDDLADVTNYKLSMDKIDKYIAAQRNIAAKAKAMTPAERAAMKARNESDDDNANESLDDMARKIESVPPMRDAIREAGLSAREFALITISMMQSAMASSVLQMRPNENQDSLAREMKANPDNIKFFREHQEEITRKTKGLEAEMKAAGVDEQ